MGRMGFGTSKARSAMPEVKSEMLDGDSSALHLGTEDRCATYTSSQSCRLTGSSCLRSDFGSILRVLKKHGNSYTNGRSCCYCVVWHERIGEIAAPTEWMGLARILINLLHGL
jgi:hypothetical protein